MKKLVMPKISAVIITYNEEKNIERCIQSVLGVADEILIVDSYSTDKTEEICKKYNARFIQHKFDGYIEQKNYATSQAAYNYVLALDADEALSDNLKTSILKVKENWDCDGYKFSRLTNYCGKWIRHTSWYPSMKLRLWDRRKGTWDGINPHDMFLMTKGSKIKHIDGDLLHYSFYSINDQINQINKFSDILAKSYHQRGLNSTYWHIIFHPSWRFIRDYFLRLGFLEGFYGFTICINASFEVFLKYVKLKKLISDERSSKPFRVCIYTSSIKIGSEEEWLIKHSQRLSENGYEPIIAMNPISEFQNKIKNAKLAFYDIITGNYSYLNPVKLILLARFYKRQKIGTIIVNNSNDLKIVTLSAKLAGVKNIQFYKSDLFIIPSTFFNKYFFTKVASNIIINSKKLKYAVLMYNYKLFSKEKILVMDEEYSNKPGKKLLLNIA